MDAWDAAIEPYPAERLHCDPEALIGEEEPRMATLQEKLAEESGTLRWAELQRHFARGAVIVVADRLDLLEVAQAMARDDHAALAGWLAAGLVNRATDDQARAWQAADAELAAVVVAPFVVVREVSDD
jgi:hypothetical protein